MPEFENFTDKIDNLVIAWLSNKTHGKSSGMPPN
jgi:hypothetical protein